jgi:hypothetical protein
MFSLVRAFGAAPDDFDPSVLSQMTAAQRLMGEKFVATGELHQDEPRLILRLEKRHLLEDLGELEGEVAVVAKVLKKLNEGESAPLINFPGLDLMPRRARRSVQFDDDVETIQGPAVSLDVIAIYR